MLDLADRQRLLKEAFITEAVDIIDHVLHRVVGASLPASEIQAVAESVSKNLSSGVRV
jgi:inorganic pyrophosphatase/exopolyphosphatase